MISIEPHENYFKVGIYDDEYFAHNLREVDIVIKHHFAKPHNEYDCPICRKTKKYPLRVGLPEHKLREYLATLLDEVASINEDELTTFELRFIRAFSSNPPTRTHGAEWPKTNADAS